jgi:hypothetical protein
VSLTPSSLYTNDNLSATVTSSDADGDTVRLSYQWYVNGVPRGSDASSVSGATWFDKGDSVYVVVTPDDGEESGSASTSSSVTVRNSAPSAPVVRIDPVDPVAGDTLVCNVDTEATDADGDAITYSFRWTQDGSAFSAAGTTYETGDTVAGTYVQDAEAWVCSVTAGDGEATGTSARDSVGVCATGTAEICPASSCAAILSADPTSSSGLYWIESDAAGAVVTACDFSTESGGWTAVFLASSTDYASSSIPYTLDNASLMTSASEVLMGFVNASGAGVTDWARFSLPANWRTASPMSFTSETTTVSAKFDDGTTATRTLYYGYWNFYGECGYWQSPAEAIPQGRVGFCNSGGPLFTSFSYDGYTDACNAYSGRWAGQACTSSRRFAIFVR